MTSEAMMPNGTSCLGLRHSSAAVETESNPMYVKNTIAPPVRTPWNPLGAKGFQFATETKRDAAIRKITMATSFTATMKLFAPALSRMPITRITVSIITTRNPGRLKYAPVRRSEPSSTGFMSEGGRWMPSPTSRLSA